MPETKPTDRDDRAAQIRKDVPGKLARWRLRKLLSNLYTGEMKILDPPERVKDCEARQ